MSGIDGAAVTAALKDEGLEVHADEEEGQWGMSFELNARKQYAVLIAPQSLRDEPMLNRYFLAISFIESDVLNKAIEQLPAEVLRTLLKVQAEVLLAKIDYWGLDDEPIYAAISPCSVVNVDGPKLRRRLEACADLAARVRAALMELASGGETDHGA